VGRSNTQSVPIAGLASRIKETDALVPGRIERASDPWFGRGSRSFFDERVPVRLASSGHRSRPSSVRSSIGLLKRTGLL
jgi:hypothetical protein